MHYSLIDFHLSPLKRCFDSSEVFKLSDDLQLQSIDVDGAISLGAELQKLNLLNV